MAAMRAELDDLRMQMRQIPMRWPSTAFKTNMWRVVGGKPLGYSGLIGATYQTALPDSLPEYDVDTMPTTADGVGYILSHDTGETALLWNGPPGNTQFANSQAHLWVGMRLLCVDTIKIQITKQKVPDPENPGEEIDDPNEPTRFQTFYVNAVLL
jgi:hypothetical protein